MPDLPADEKAPAEPPGVSVTFFARAVKALTRQHGKRSCADLNLLIPALAAAERVWIESPRVKKRQGPPGAKGKGDE